MTKAERAWLGRVKQAGCLCCLSLGLDHDPDGPMVEAHHLLDGGMRRGHDATVGLCQWHHRGRLMLEGWTHAMHREFLGPSLAEGSVPFHARFGDDDALIARQRDVLGVAA